MSARWLVSVDRELQPRRTEWMRELDRNSRPSFCEMSDLSVSARQNRLLARHRVKSEGGVGMEELSGRDPSVGVPEARCSVLLTGKVSLQTEDRVGDDQFQPRVWLLSVEELQAAVALGVVLSCEIEVGETQVA